MEKEFVPYELAVKLKALGFNEPCFKYVYIGDTGNNFDHYLEVEPSKAKNYNEDDLCISQPTFSQAFRWFRDKHDIVSYINRFEDNTFDYECNSPKFKEVIDFEDGPFDTYEEAELACLERLIDKITNKKIFDFVTEL